MVAVGMHFLICNSSHLADSLHALFAFPMYLAGGAPPDVLSWVTIGIILFSGGKGPRMANLEVMRAEAEWQRAGAYSVRIQGMNRQHHKCHLFPQMVAWLSR